MNCSDCDLQYNTGHKEGFKVLNQKKISKNASKILIGSPNKIIYQYKNTNILKYEKIFFSLLQYLLMTMYYDKGLL